jgi:hypothetical protein
MTLCVFGAGDCQPNRKGSKLNKTRNFQDNPNNIAAYTLHKEIVEHRAAEKLQQVAALTATEEQRAADELAAEQKLEQYIDELRGMTLEEACQRIEKEEVRYMGETQTWGSHQPRLSFFKHLRRFLTPANL